MTIIAGEPRPSPDPRVIIVPFKRPGGEWHDCKIVKRLGRDQDYLRSLINFMRWIVR